MQVGGHDMYYRNSSYFLLCPSHYNINLITERLKQLQFTSQLLSIYHHLYLICDCQRKSGHQGFLCIIMHILFWDAMIRTITLMLFYVIKALTRLLSHWAGTLGPVWSSSGRRRQPTVVGWRWTGLLAGCPAPLLLLTGQTVGGHRPDNEIHTQIR